MSIVLSLSITNWTARILLHCTNISNFLGFHCKYFECNSERVFPMNEILTQYSATKQQIEMCVSHYIAPTGTLLQILGK